MARATLGREPPAFFRQGPSAFSRLLVFSALALLVMVADARFHVMQPLRTALSVLAMSIGVAAVVILTALGDGARRYVVGQFSSLGTNLVIVLPGRSGTGGFNPANAITTTPRDLTVDEIRQLQEAVKNIEWLGRRTELGVFRRSSKRFRIIFGRRR